MLDRKCDMCLGEVKSLYSIIHGGDWYYGHKNCLGTLKNKLKAIEEGTYNEQESWDFKEQEEDKH